ncbi:MAG: homocysteine S-methyltransferase family protein, partial [Lachnospiraceae bacterium]|nr:homocysteine S-methyltransferase family protein [Lachnospiraceae bacterium]
KPYGDLDFEEAVAIYGKTIRLGAAAGVDLVFVETMSDSLDTKAAVLAAKENCDLPVFASNAYGADGKLLTGASPSAMVAMLEGLRVDAIGVNCSLGPRQMKGIVEEYLKTASLPVILKPNAGLPRQENGKTIYDISEEEFSELVADYTASGVRLIGGCCGTTPSYIEKLVKKTEGIKPVPVTDKGISMVSSYTHAVTFGDRPVLIGERINPTGKKKFKEALRNKDIGYILDEGLKQQENGAQVLDVNVGIPEIDEKEMLKTICFELQAVTDLPLQIDTTDMNAMEAALRQYNGKAMINSVNGKKEMMDAVFPLVKKYGGLTVCLTLDEEGIPETAEKRLAIARCIIETAASYGIPQKELIFDPLTMAVSADNHAAETTLTALRRISEELHALTSLGVSNVSFGLPKREVIAASFFTMAMENGLSAAIMNPNTAEMMKAYLAFCTLHGYDPDCADYIACVEKYTAVVPENVGSAGAKVPGQPASKENTDGMKQELTALEQAIVKGLREQAGELARSMLAEGADPLMLINDQIIPALDIVGRGFENNTMFLPQLLMSAEASKQAFEQIRHFMDEKNEQTASRGKFVIATVYGDVHDIGKNIVRMLLENYGFDVIDLGKNVPAEVIVETVLRENVGLVGLSALMTTTVPAMEETIRLLREKAPGVKVVVGGAVLTQEYADRIGADFYGKDAMATVRYALQANRRRGEKP